MIRVGIGGWTFPAWRGSFYPPGLVQRRELEFASHALSAIEINATFRSLQKPESFAKWAKVAPDDFVFTVKGSRFVTSRKRLADAGEGIARFIDQGLVELGEKLGPILWQLPHTKTFDPDDIAAFLQLLPRSHAGVALRHAIQPRHESFAVPAFVALARGAGIAIAYADSAKYPAIADPTADFIYARLENAAAEQPAGYAPDRLDSWAANARIWAAGGRPDGLSYVEETSPVVKRDTFVFFINGAKERAPAGALALIERLRA